MLKALIAIPLSLLLLGTSVPSGTVPGKFVGWNPNRPLTWKDFKGKPDKRSPAAALSHVGIPYSYKSNKEGNIVVNLRCVFDKSKSWVKPGKTARLLSHEQFHFNIGELHVRKMRKAIHGLSAKPIKTFDKRFKKVFDSYYKKYRAAQKAYDKETNHSINEAVQQSWERKTTAEFAKYADYKYATIVLKVN